jgi:hypothetical protein
MYFFIQNSSFENVLLHPELGGQEKVGGGSNCGGDDSNSSNCDGGAANCGPFQLEDEVGEELDTASKVKTSGVQVIMLCCVNLSTFFI